MDHHDPHESFAERQTRLEQLFHLVGYQPETEVDDEILAERSRRWSSRAIAVAGLFLLVFNTHALKSWAASLPPDWTGETLRVLSDAWSQRLAELGLERARQTLRGIIGMKVIEEKATVEEGEIVEYRVTLQVIFLLDEADPAGDGA